MLTPVLLASVLPLIPVLLASALPAVLEAVYASLQQLMQASLHGHTDAAAGWKAT